MGHRKVDIARGIEAKPVEVPTLPAGQRLGDSGFNWRQQMAFLRERIGDRALASAMRMDAGIIRNALERNGSISQEHLSRLELVVSAFDNLTKIGGPQLARDYLGSKNRAGNGSALETIARRGATDPKVRDLVMHVMEKDFEGAQPRA